MMTRKSGPCPDDEGGTHHPTRVGYDEALCGVVWLCTCGHILLLPTDEMRHALGETDLMKKLSSG